MHASCPPPDSTRAQNEPGPPVQSASFSQKRMQRFAVGYTTQPIPGSQELTAPVQTSRSGVVPAASQLTAVRSPFG